MAYAKKDKNGKVTLHESPNVKIYMRLVDLKNKVK